MGKFSEFRNRLLNSKPISEFTLSSNEIFFWRVLNNLSDIGFCIIVTTHKVARSDREWNDHLSSAEVQKYLLLQLGVLDDAILSAKFNSSA